MSIQLTRLSDAKYIFMQLHVTAISSALCTALLLFGSGGSVAAQQSKSDPKPPAPAMTDLEKDDILILVNVTAKELKFDVVPDPKVEFPGKPDRATVWVTDRFNLPEQVEPGVTYRDIGINLRISSRFADIERIVREALGEISATQQAPSETVSAAGRKPQKARNRPKKSL